MAHLSAFPETIGLGVDEAAIAVVAGGGGGGGGYC